jgi:hypothetical protein
MLLFHFMQIESDSSLVVKCVSGSSFKNECRSGYTFKNIKFVKEITSFYMKMLNENKVTYRYSFLPIALPFMPNYRVFSTFFFQFNSF